MHFAPLLLAGVLAFAQPPAQATAPSSTTRIKAFLDCSSTFCHEEYLREEVELVEYVRDRTDADVHVLITSAETGARGREFTFAFIGQGRFASIRRTLTVTSAPDDPEERVRRALATALVLGLLQFIAPDSVPASLTVDAEIAASAAQVGSAADDPWKRWIFSLEGNMSIDYEESTRERDWGLSMSADRITPEWKLTFGSNFNQSREEFDLDEDEPLSVERRSRNFALLSVWSLGEHWSVGARSNVRSSTFDNTEFEIQLSPALEWDFFPYSMYTRRQLRVLYSVGAAQFRYYEETLFGKTEESRARQQAWVVYEQREPWGTLEGSLDYSNYFPGLSTYRLGVNAEVDVRITRGLSLSLEASTSRIRDQLSLPRRDATPEEVLLRLRRLRSGFQTSVEFGITYQFGSRFASIVNPRFGR